MAKRKLTWTTRIGLGIRLISLECDRLRNRNRVVNFGVVVVVVGGGTRKVIDFGDDILEGKLDVGGVKSGGFDEGETVFLREAFGLISGDLAKVTKIALISDEHDDDV